MSRSCVIVSMKSGEKHRIVGFEESITQIINTARAHNGLLRLELDLTPTGQYVSVDPHEVESVKGDGW